jgi:hypothetical protein
MYFLMGRKDDLSGVGAMTAKSVIEIAAMI